MKNRRDDGAEALKGMGTEDRERQYRRDQETQRTGARGRGGMVQQKQEKE